MSFLQIPPIDLFLNSVDKKTKTSCYDVAAEEMLVCCHHKHAHLSLMALLHRKSKKEKKIVLQQKQCLVKLDTLSALEWNNNYY